MQQDIAALRAALALEMSEARIEVHMLLQAVLQVPRAWLLAHPEHVMSADDEKAYQTLLARRLAGEPMAHILGEREFYGLNLKVTPATLIPRPDTESLVEQALQRLPSGNGVRVLDLGTGAGAVALAIAYGRPQAEVVAVDASAAALAVAQENAQRLALANVRCLLSDWFAGVPDTAFDLIVSNPPYIPDADPHLTQGDLRFEPRSALASGADGLADIRRIVAQAGAYLKPGGWLLLEHGYDQALAVRGLLQAAGFVEVFSARDLGGIERVSGGRQV
ncbi:MAG: peptide chain release factor N(5)-glutamine methyltransferase [Pseudomonadota bacterium]